MKRAVFEVKQNPMGSYYFAFKDPLGETVAVSCNFPDRAALESCLAKVRDTAMVSTVYCDATNGGKLPCFLVEENECGAKFSLIGFLGEIIYSSISYLRKEACCRAICMLKEHSQRAQIIDLTIN